MANSFGRNYSTRQTSGGTDIYDLNDGTFNPSTYTGQESVTFPNGMIMKMGEVSSSASSTTITFASAFPNSVVSVIASSIKAGAANNDSDANISSVSTTGFTVTRVTTTGGHTGIYWQAIGH